MRNTIALFLFAGLLPALIPAARAKTVRYELTVRNQPVNLSGLRTVDFALTVNGGIPAPTLEFTEGDDAEILVRNELAKEEVSIHWHGILLPPQEDGVAYVNTPPIFPGQSRLFRFPIRQNGTFWYHSHTGVQEQKGVYGALIIHPRKKPVAYDRDAVLVLSDWSDENADQIIRNLRKDGDYYLYKKDAVRSYGGTLRAGALGLYLRNEWQRMGGMDLSDVGYDAFLINGRRSLQLPDFRPGEKIRVRVINAAASSYFYVAMGVPMQVIAADGVDVAPVLANELLLGMAETYDFLFTVPPGKSHEIRATAQDGTGSASAWIGTGAPVAAPARPAPDPYAPMDHGTEHGAHAAAAAEHSDHSSHSEHSDHGSSASHAAHSEHSDHEGHGAAAVDWSSQSGAVLQQNSAARQTARGNPVATLTVDGLQSLLPTTLPADAKVHELRLTLGGDMERYVWHLNGRAIHEDRLLEIRRGEIVRISFVNETMMHHPMHLHGHFFRVNNAHGDRSPLKHTVDVPPHGTRTIEFYANEPGQWMLHCHNLYHMKTGMARVVRYTDFALTPAMQHGEHQDPHAHDHVYSLTQLEAATNHAKARQRWTRTWDELHLQAEASRIGKSLSLRGKWESEGDLFYRRWWGNFFRISGGGTAYDGKFFGQAGLGAILPMLIEADIAVNHEGHFRIDLEKKFQWTKDVFSEAELTWRPDWGGAHEAEVEVSLMYGPAWNWAAGLMLTNESVGVGAQLRF